MLEFSISAIRQRKLDGSAPRWKFSFESIAEKKKFTEAYTLIKG